MSTDLLDKLESQISIKRAELADLETAARVLRKLLEAPEARAGSGSSTASNAGGANGNGEVRPAPETGHPRRDLEGQTIMAASMVILRERGGGPLHYREIADEAVARGYTSNRGATPESVRRSFWDTLRRRPDPRVAFMGRGRFELQDNARAGEG